MRLLQLCVLAALTGCIPDRPPRPESVLVCTQDGREVFRSKLRGTWYMYNSGAWVVLGANETYRPSMLESCRTEDAE